MRLRRIDRRSVTSSHRRSNSRKPGLERMEPRTLLSAVSWTGDAHDNNWDTPGNWNTNSLPGAGDDVTINVAADVVHSSSVTDTINSLTSTEPLTISGGTLSITSASTTSADLTISGGTLTGAGNLSVGGLLTLSGGTLSGSSTLTANGGILINTPGNTFFLDGRTLTSAAGQTATWSGPGNTVEMLDGAVFNNLGTFLAETTGTIEQGSGANSSFNNDGTFTKSTSSGTVNIQNGISFNVASGSVDVQDGTLSLFGGGTDTGATFTVESGNTLNFGSSHSLDSASSISGAGTVGFDGGVPGTVAMAGTYDVTGSTIDNYSSGTVNFTGTVNSIGAAFTSSSGTMNFNSAFPGTAGTIPTVVVNGGTANFGTNALSAATLTITGGTLTGTGVITVSGLTTFSGGTIAGSGDVNANGGFLINSPGNTVFIDGRTIVNPVGQTATWSGPGGAIETLDGAVFNNKGTFLAETTGSFEQGSGANSSFNNDGTFTKSTSSGTVNIQNGISFNVAGGSVDVQDGTLSLFGGGTDTGATFTVESGNTLNFGSSHSLDSASSISGAGTVGFDGGVPGTVAMAGTYDVTGATIDNYSSGTVNFTGTVNSIGSAFTSSSGTMNFNSAFSGTAGTIPTVVVNGGTANFGTNALSATTLTITGGTLTGTGVITVSGLTTFSGGTIAGSGDVNADGGILINSPGNTVFIDGRTVVNPVGQTATWSGPGGAIETLDGAVFNNLGTFVAETTGSFEQGSGANSSFNNDGTFTKSTNSGTVNIQNGISFNVAGGSVDVQDGTLSLFGGGTDTGATFTVESGNTLNFGSSHSLDSASSISGAGTVGFDGGVPGTVAMAGTYDVTGATVDNYSSGTVNFTGTVNSIGSAFTSSSGTMNFNSAFSGTAGTIPTVVVNGGTANFGTNALDATTITITGGTLTGTGVITVSGLTTFSGGTIAGSGDVNANGGFLINSPGNTVFIDGRTVINAAGQTATWSAPGGDIEMLDGAVFNNEGTFLAETTGTIEQGGGANSSFNNSGNFTKSTNSGVVNFGPGVSFNVAGGTVDVQTGELGLMGGGTSTSAAYTIESGTTLDLSGSAPFSLDSASTLTGTGNFISEPTSTVTLGGNSPSFTGPTAVNRGALLVNGSQANSPVADNAGSTVGGNGTVGSVTTTDATVSPGDSGPGILNTQGDVMFDAQSFFVVALDGSNPGTGGYSQLNANGTVNLAGSRLTSSLGFTPADGESFTIIKSTAPIVGTFNGLAEGASFTINSVPFKITYAGGGGDDVVLTQATTLTATTTTVGSSQNPSSVGQQVTFTATVAPTSGTGTPTGDVTFTIDGTPETPVPLQVVGGHDQASFPISTLGVGQHTVSATYNGDTTFGQSTGTLAPEQTVNLLGTSTAVVSSANPSSVGEQVTFTATVAPTAGTGTPTGTVTFTIDGTPETPVPLQVVGGHDQASFPISTLGVGEHAVSATYNGDTSFAQSTGTLSPEQVVNALATTTAVASSENPSNVGDQVTFTATVAPTSGTGTPSGTVTFTIDGTAQTPVPLQVVSGMDQASFPISTLSGGNHTVSAAYNGDTSFAQSTGALSPEQTVNLLGTTTTTVSSLNPSNVGQQVTITATVAPASGTGTPTGTVTFTIDGTAEAPVNLQVVDGMDQAAFPISTLGAGSHSVSATYNGDSSFGQSTGALSPDQTVNVQLTSMKLFSSSNPSTFGQSVTFTADVFTGLVPAAAGQADPPTGTVTFLDGTATLGSAPVNGNGQAVFTVSTLSVGSHSITAHYGGDANFVSSTSNAVNQVVNASTIVAPTVVAVQRFGYHMQPTSIVLTFSTALDPASVQDVANYTIVTLGGRGKGGSMIGHITHLKSAVYDPSTLSVTLFPAHQMDIHNFYRLTVNGIPPGGLSGATGLALDGKGDGIPGSNYVAFISAKTVAGPASAAGAAARERAAARAHVNSHAAAKAVDALAASGELSARPFVLGSHARNRRRHG